MTRGAGSQLFVSYRRSDSEGSAGRLADALASQFRSVFLDSQKIPFGADFIRVVAAEIARADVVVVVIGRQWLDVANERGRRLDQDDDPVRFEVRLALESGKRVVPVLVDGATPPPADRLPPVLAPLARLNMAEVRNAAFADDFDRLVDALLERPRGWPRTEIDRLRRLVVGARGTAVLAPLAALLAALGAWTGFFDLLHLDTHAQRALLAQASPAPDPPVVLVTIDPESERRLGRSWPAPRAAWRASHAAVVDRAAAAGARAVVFDLAFECPQADDACDREFEPLAAAARRAAARRPATRVVFGVRRPGEGGPQLAAPLRTAGRAGHVCLFDRGAGALFSVPLAVWRGAAPAVVGVDATPALAVAALVAEPVRSVDLERRVVDFDGPPRDPPVAFSTVERRRDAGGECPLIAAGDLAATMLLRPAPEGRWSAAGRHLPYAALLDPAAAVDPVLGGRIVLVGLATPAARDRFSVQQGFGSRSVYGVELHAEAIAVLASGRVPRLAGVGLQALTGFAAALVGAALALGATRGPWRAAAAGVGMACAWVAACAAFARGQLLLNPAYDLAAMGLAAGGALLLLRFARRLPPLRSAE